MVLILGESHVRMALTTCTICQFVDTVMSCINNDTIAPIDLLYSCYLIAAVVIANNPV